MFHTPNMVADAINNTESYFVIEKQTTVVMQHVINDPLFITNKKYLHPTQHALFPVIRMMIDNRAHPVYLLGQNHAHKHMR